MDSSHTAPHSNNPFYWYARCFRRFADFAGRSRRKEYWCFALVNFLVLLSCFFVGAFGTDDPTSFAAVAPRWIYLAIVFLPGLAVNVRRLHDIGRSGGWVFLQLVPYLGPLVLMIFAMLPGDVGSNAYGPDPKEPAEVDLGELQQVFS